MDSFFSDRVKDYNGGPRTLAQTLEGIDLCIAARKSLTPELTAFLNQLLNRYPSANGRIGDPVPPRNLERSGDEDKFVDAIAR